MNHLKTICLLALGWPLLACDPLEPSDEGQYNLAIDLSDDLGLDSRRVLVGTRFELVIKELRGREIKGADIMPSFSSSSPSDVPGIWTTRGSFMG